MLAYTNTRDILTALPLTPNEKCNSSDHDLLYHARYLMDISREVNMQLAAMMTLLEERQSYVTNTLACLNDQLGLTRPILLAIEAWSIAFTPQGVRAPGIYVFKL